MGSAPKRIVILGAGYAGIRTALDLAYAKKRGANIEITLVCDRAYHIDTPALYEVATAYLHRESTTSSETIGEGVGVPLNEIFAGLPLSVRVHTVHDIIPAQRLINMSDGSAISFDTLVIALGARTATFGIPGVVEHAFSVKTINEALELRHHIVRQFMMAKKLLPHERANSLSFAVVGAGATGVEIAAELCGQIKQLCARHQIDATCPRVFLIEATSEILPTAPAGLQQYATRRLQHLGVELLTGQPITSVAENGVTFTDGHVLPVATVIWTGGLKVHPVLTGAQLPLKSWGVACMDTLQVEGHPNIFAAGDAAVITTSLSKIPGVVPVAYTEGALVAQNILRQQNDQPLLTYRYQTLGALITVGGKCAVAILPGNRTLVGWLAWALKKMVVLRYWASVLSPIRALSFWWHGLRLHSLND